LWATTKVERATCSYIGWELPTRLCLVQTSVISPQNTGADDVLPVLLRFSASFVGDHLALFLSATSILLLRLFRSISTAFAVVFFLKFSFFLPFHISLIQKAVLLMDKSDGQWIF
jgi:hypothetical protein